MKKGFTLIELLAVIIIISILAVVTIPSVIKTINDSKENSAIHSTVGYVDAVNYRLSESTLENIVVEDGTYYVDELGIEIELKGQAPSMGYLTIKNNEVKEALLCFNNYKIEYKDGTKEDTTIIGKCDKETLIYQEGILNGADPLLIDGLVPVILNDDGTVIKADINKPWYKYSNKQWANAVILDTDYEYEVGDEILEEDIKAYFVWVPKYSYKLFELGIDIDTDSILEKAHSIDIKFGVNDTLDRRENECTTSLKSGEVESCKVGDYMTHPAFLAFDINGFWASKFETTGTTEQITIKPNLTSLRNLTIAEMFTLSYDFRRENNSHMMKNTEWGAISYLAHSKYGIDSKIEINNSGVNYLTGYSGTSKYGEKATASTTGNITGIYDMSGNAYELVAAYLYGIDKDNFDYDKYEKEYFDIYKGTSYNYRILGDATAELGPFKPSETDSNVILNSWYQDRANPISTNSGWFARGSHYSNGGTNLYFAAGDGTNYPYITFRIVLTK